MTRASLNTLLVVRGVIAVVFAATAASCVGFDQPDSFDSVDPAGRMHAAAAAAASSDRTALPELIEMLRSDDLAERLVAIGTLERLTGERFGYDPSASDESRRAAIGRWEARAASGGWGGGEGGNPATVSGGRTSR